MEKVDVITTLEEIEKNEGLDLLDIDLHWGLYIDLARYERIRERNLEFVSRDYEKKYLEFRKTIQPVDCAFESRGYPSVKQKAPVSPRHVQTHWDTLADLVQHGDYRPCTLISEQLRCGDKGCLPLAISTVADMARWVNNLRFVSVKVLEGMKKGTGAQWFMKEGTWVLNKMLNSCLLHSDMPPRRIVFALFYANRLQDEGGREIYEDWRRKNLPKDLSCCRRNSLILVYERLVVNILFDMAFAEKTEKMDLRRLLNRAELLANYLGLGEMRECTNIDWDGDGVYDLIKELYYRPIALKIDMLTKSCDYPGCDLHDMHVADVVSRECYTQMLMAGEEKSVERGDIE